MNKVIFLLALASLFFNGCYFGTTGWDGPSRDPADWARVTGHVYFKDSGKPAAGALVSLQIDNGGRTSYADASGFYQIGAGTGTYLLTARYNGYQQYRHRIVIQNNRSYTYDIHLVPIDSNQVTQ